MREQYHQHHHPQPTNKQNTHKIRTSRKKETKTDREGNFTIHTKEEREGAGGGFTSMQMRESHASPAASNKDCRQPLAARASTHIYKDSLRGGNNEAER